MEHRDIQHPRSDAEIEASKQAAHDELKARVAELEKRISKLEGK